MFNVYVSGDCVKTHLFLRNEAEINDMESVKDAIADYIDHEEPYVTKKEILDSFKFEKKIKFQTYKGISYYNPPKSEDECSYVTKMVTCPEYIATFDPINLKIIHEIDGLRTEQIFTYEEVA